MKKNKAKKEWKKPNISKKGNLRSVTGISG